MSEETTSPEAPQKAPTGVSAWWRALSIFLTLVVFIGWAFSASMYEQFKAQIHHLEAKLVEIPQVCISVARRITGTCHAADLRSEKSKAASAAFE
jgi:hypothetical protein